MPPVFARSSTPPIFEVFIKPVLANSIEFASILTSPEAVIVPAISTPAEVLILLPLRRFVKSVLNADQLESVSGISVEAPEVGIV